MESRELKKIQSAFAGDYPNGYVLGWDSERFFFDLQKLAKGYELVNDTDFNYSRCNDFAFCTTDQKEHCSLKISFILDCFWLSFWQVKNRQGILGHVVERQLMNPDLGRLSMRLKLFLESQSFFEVSKDDLNLVVPGVRLELAEQATIEKCLFEDYY
ncbi:MAG: hypothetical protein H6510_12610 [Acidobacteria bacterium]|nr:hypothetical protein [Acidobacteriota bacterium]MCB9398648.1 hypothetical protein [Acidobacteriota bacterium]